MYRQLHYRKIYNLTADHIGYTVEKEEDMTKANKEILKTFRKLKKAFDESVSYPDWIGRRCKILSETTANVSLNAFRKLSDSICK